jgi:hypothetical protein
MPLLPLLALGAGALYLLGKRDTSAVEDKSGPPWDNAEEKLAYNTGYSHGVFDGKKGVPKSPDPAGQKGAGVVIDQGTRIAFNKGYSSGYLSTYEGKPSPAPSPGKKSEPTSSGGGSPLTPSAAACKDTFSKLPPDVVSKVNAWRAAGGAANLRMAASFLELTAKSAPAPLNATLNVAAACLRAEAEGADVGPYGKAGPGGMPTDLSIDAAICKASLDALRKSPGWEWTGAIIDGGSSKQIEGIAKSVESALPMVTNAPTKAAMQQMVVCLRALAKAKASAGGGGGGTDVKSPPTGDWYSKCLKDSSGNVIPDLGLPNLLALSPSIAAQYAASSVSAKKLRVLAAQLREGCQDQAANLVELEANGLETFGGGLVTGARRY